MTIWRRVKKFDPRAAALADRHYSRRTPGSDQFMPPGQTIVLLADAAVFGWWRPDPASGLRAMNRLDGWTCTIFRNESPVRSSELILAAEDELYEHADDVGPDGLITYVWDARVRSSNPGYCFLCAGWHRAGRSADGRKTLLQKARCELEPKQGQLALAGRPGEPNDSDQDGRRLAGALRHRADLILPALQDPGGRERQRGHVAALLDLSARGGLHGDSHQDRGER